MMHQLVNLYPSILEYIYILLFFLGPALTRKLHGLFLSVTHFLKFSIKLAKDKQETLKHESFGRSEDHWHFRCVYKLRSYHQLTANHETKLSSKPRQVNGEVWGPSNSEKVTGLEDWWWIMDHGDAERSKPRNLMKIHSLYIFDSLSMFIQYSSYTV